jgi:hypothetical protein
MRPIDNACTCRGSQRAKEKCQQLGRALALSLSPRFAEWAFMEPWKEGSATELPGGAVNVHSMLMRESAKYAVAGGHIHP